MHWILYAYSILFTNSFHSIRLNLSSYNNNNRTLKGMLLKHLNFPQLCYVFLSTSINNAGDIYIFYLNHGLMLLCLLLQKRHLSTYCWVCSWLVIRSLVLLLFMTHCLVLLFPSSATMLIFVVDVARGRHPLLGVLVWRGPTVWRPL